MKRKKFMCNQKVTITQLLTLTRLRIRRKKGVLYTIGQKHDNLLDKKRSYFPVLNSLVIGRKEEKRIIGCLTPFDLINLLLYFQTFKIIKLQHNEKKNQIPTTHHDTL